MSYRKDFIIAEDLYLKAFPEEERRSLESITNLLKEEYFEFVPIFFDDKFKGFANLWFFNDFTYIEHFAIIQEERNKGYGTQFLKNLITNKIPNLKHKISNIVLEVEPSTNLIAKKRISFYENLGFKLLNDYYFQPPYTLNSKGLEMKLMFLNTNTEKQISFLKIKETLYNNVYCIKQNKPH